MGDLGGELTRMRAQRAFRIVSCGLLQLLDNVAIAQITANIRMPLLPEWQRAGVERAQCREPLRTTVTPPTT